MSGSGRSVRAVALMVPPERRGRFIEEWQADLGAATAADVSERGLLVAAVRVAILLLWLRVRTRIGQGLGLLQSAGIGCVAGLALVVADVRVEPMVPFLALLGGWRLWHALLAWITGPR